MMPCAQNCSSGQRPGASTCLRVLLSRPGATGPRPLEIATVQTISTQHLVVFDHVGALSCLIPARTLPKTDKENCLERPFCIPWLFVGEGNGKRTLSLVPGKWPRPIKCTLQASLKGGNVGRRSRWINQRCPLQFHPQKVNLQSRKLFGCG